MTESFQHRSIVRQTKQVNLLARNKFIGRQNRRLTDVLPASAAAAHTARARRAFFSPRPAKIHYFRRSGIVPRFNRTLSRFRRQR
jgi:hypothetical protein